MRQPTSDSDRSSGDTIPLRLSSVNDIRLCSDRGLPLPLLPAAAATFCCLLFFFFPPPPLAFFLLPWELLPKQPNSEPHPSLAPAAGL